MSFTRRFLVPVITHQTKAKERRHVLDGFAEGTYPVVVTSRVLNEGVDVPSANVGVVLSGTGTVREHVQRLGRLLRKLGDKQAILYEVVTRGTGKSSPANGAGSMGRISNNQVTSPRGLIWSSFCALLQRFRRASSFALARRCSSSGASGAAISKLSWIRGNSASCRIP